MLARLFVIVGGVFVLALVLALVGPYFIDWSSYRAEFEREASAVLGRKVTVEGKAGVRILPFPSVTFTDVSVGAGSGGEAAMTVDTFSMDAELAPLLHGEFLIFDMRLVRPKAVVDIASDGTVDWAVRPSAPFDAGSIAVENLSITDGEVVIRHGPSGREHVVSDIDARLSALSLAGPWTGSATLNLDGQRASLSGSTGAAESDGIRLRLEALPDAAPVRISTEGNVRIENGKTAYSGQLRVAQVASEPAKEKNASPKASSFRLDGKFSLDARQLALTEFRFETGPTADPYTAEGTASLVFDGTPRFALKANGDQLRLDETDEGKTGRDGGVSLSARLAGFEQAVRELPKPGIPGTIDLNLPALVAGDTTVRDLKLSAEPDEGGWRIRSLSASLPGRTTLEAQGLLAAGERFGFDGSLLVAVAQPSGFAAWLGRDVDEAVRRLPSAGFSAKVRLDAERQTFSDLEIVLGAARLKGSADSRMPAGGRPTLGLQLSGGQVDLDQMDAFASLLIGDEGLGGLGGRDLDLALKAGPLRAGGFSADGVDVALKLRESGLAVDRLTVNGLAGAAIEASGSFSGPDNARRGDLMGTLSAPDLGPLVEKAAELFPRNVALRKLNDRSRAFPGLLAGSNLKLALRGTPGSDGGQKVTFTADGKAGGTDLSLVLTSKTGLEDWGQGDLEVEASLRNADAAALLALCGLPSAPLRLTGPAEMKLSAHGVPLAGLATRATLGGEKLSASFDGTVAPLAAGGFAIKGPVRLDAEDIEPWMLTLGAGLPGFGLGTPANLRADADYADGLLVLSGFSGSLDEGAVSGDVNIALKNGLPEINGALTLDDFDLLRAASVLFGESAFDEEADGAMKTPFRQKAPAPFTAGLTISAGSLSAGPLGTLYDANLTLSLDAQRIALDALSATFDGGKLKGSAEIKNSGGDGFLSAQFDLKGSGVEAAVENAALRATGDFSGSLTASGKSVDALIAGLSGSGTAMLHDLEITGVNAAAFPRLLAGGDATGRDIDAAAVDRFAPAVLKDGKFLANRADFAFTVTSGVLRTPPLSVANPSATLTADLRADLPARTVAARGRVAFEPGADGLVGSEPAAGFALDGGFTSAELRFDTAPLAQFLVQRTLEREQARVEDLQAGLLEKQRLRREVRYYASLKAEHDREGAEQERRTQAAQIRVEDRAALEAAETRRSKADEAAREETAEKERKKVEAAIRLAESERAKQAASPTPPKPEPVPSARSLNLDALQPLMASPP